MIIAAVVYMQHAMHQAFLIKNVIYDMIYMFKANSNGTTLQIKENVYLR